MMDSKNSSQAIQSPISCLSKTLGQRIISEIKNVMPAEQLIDSLRCALFGKKLLCKLDAVLRKESKHV